MVTHVRRTLLMITTLLGVQTPPGRPPGRKPVQSKPPAATVPLTGPCPYPGCQGEGDWQKGFLYLCNTCNKPSYYCTSCNKFYPRGKEGEHKHKLPAA